MSLNTVYAEEKALALMEALCNVNLLPASTEYATSVVAAFAAVVELETAMISNIFHLKHR